jgi:hypothetical protein
MIDALVQIAADHPFAVVATAEPVVQIIRKATHGD